MMSNESPAPRSVVYAATGDSPAAVEPSPAPVPPPLAASLEREDSPSAAAPTAPAVTVATLAAAAASATIASEATARTAPRGSISAGSPTLTANGSFATTVAGPTFLVMEGRSLEAAKGSPIASFRVYARIASSTETLKLLYSSESVGERSPKWLPVSDFWYRPLVDGNLSLEMRIEVWDENLLGLDQSLIGSFTTTAGDLTKDSGHGVLSEDGKLRGSVFVRRCTQSELPSGSTYTLAAESSTLESGHPSAQADKWFSPPIDVQAAVAGQSPLTFNREGFLKIAVFGKCYTFDLLAIISNLIISFVLLFVAWLVLGTSMEPGGTVFSPLITIFTGSILGLCIARMTGCPPLVGMLLAGVLLGNLPNSFARGTSAGFSSFLRTIAVAVILTRAGLTFKWSLTKPVLKNVALMSCIPQLGECFTHAIVASQMFAYPNFALALYQGAAIASCSTAIVIPGVVEQQNNGYGITRGPTILMLCSVALDSVFAIWFTSFVVEFAVPNPVKNAPLWVKLLAAPVQILGGAVFGVVFGALEHWLFSHLHERISKADDGSRKSVESAVRMKCLAMSIASSVGINFGAYKLAVPGAGTVAVVVKAVYVAHKWGNPAHDERRVALYHDCADLWDDIIVPGLFTIVGASIDLSAFADINLLLRALMCIAAGLAVKACLCVLVSRGVGYSTKEKLFLAIGWCAKSTVQAATAGKVLVYALEMEAGNDPEKMALKAATVEAGKMINLIVVSSIAICAVGAGVAMSVTGPKLLTREALPEGQHDKGH